MTPRGAFLLSLLAFAFIVVVSSGPVVLAQRTSQGVVTPGDPIWAGAQEPQEPQEPPTGNDAPAGGRGGRGAGGGPPQPRPYDQVITSDARSDDGIFKVHRVREQLLLRDTKGRAGQGFPLGQPDEADDGGRRAWRRSRRQSRRALGAARESRAPPPRRLQPRGRSIGPIARAVADATNPAIVRVFNVAAFSRGRRSGGRGDTAVSHRSSGAVRPRAHRRPRIRSEPHPSREGRLVSREHQRRGDADLYRAARRRRASRGPCTRRPPRCVATAPPS